MSRARRLAPLRAWLSGKGAGLWYVSVNGENYGPYSASRMLGMLRAGRISSRTLVWTQELESWMPLAQVELFAGELRRGESGERAEPSGKDAPPGESRPSRQERPDDVALPVADEVSTAREQVEVEEAWHYIKGGRKVGPLSLERIIDAAREGRIEPDDRVWSNRAGHWQDVSEVPELTSALKEGRAGQGTLWYYRQQGKVTGPLRFEELERLVVERAVWIGAEVYSKELAEWLDIRRAPQLQRALAAAQAGLGAADAQREQWYFMQEGKERGPVTERLLAEMIANGSLGGDDRVWGPGFEDWLPLRSVPRLARRMAGGVPESVRRESRAVFSRQASVGFLAAGVHRWLLGSAAVLLIAAIAVVCYLSTGEKTPEAPGHGGMLPGSRPEAEEVVRDWLELFARDHSDMSAVERQALQEELRRFSPGGYLDCYSEDARLAAVRAGDLAAEELPCHLVRSEDREHFCYHVQFAASSVRVKAPGATSLGSDELREVEKSFGRNEFVPLRCFEVRSRAGARVHPSALVLTTDTENGAAVVAFGRLAHVGAAAGGRQVAYACGIKSCSAAEADALIRIGVEETLAGAEAWQAFGEAMRLDGRLVPGTVKEKLLAALRGEPDGKGVMVFGRSRMSLSQVEEVFGPAPRAERVETSRGRFRAVSAGPGPLYAQLTVHYYGSLGLCTDGEGNQIVAFLFTRSAAALK